MINVFICTYNPIQDILKRTVDAVLAQDLDQKLWDFTIIDNNSTTPVSEIDFVKALNINVVIEKTPGLTAARKCAAITATQDIIVFVDDDNILQKNYLTVMLDIFNNNDIGIVSGNVYPEYQQQPEEWFYPFEEMVAIRKVQSDKLVINEKVVFNEIFPIGAGMGIRKKILEDYFLLHLAAAEKIEGRKGNDLSSCEDLDIDFYALSSGYKMGVSPLLQLTHIIPANRVSVNYISRLAASCMKSNYQVNNKWRPVFNINVFPVFDRPYFKLVLKMLYYKLLSANNNYYKIEYITLKNIIKYKLKG